MPGLYGRKAVRRMKKSRVVTALALFVAGCLLAGAILAGSLVRAGAGEKEIHSYLLRGERSLSQAEFDQLLALPGLTAGGKICQVTTELSVDGFQGTGELLGVELEEFPLSLLASAGEVTYGSRLALAVGGGALGQLRDLGQSRPSKRQLALWQTYPGEVELELEEGTKGLLLGIAGSEEREDSRLYGDYRQVEAYGTARGKELFHMAWISLQGKEEREASLAALTEAGYQVEEMG